MNQHKDALRSLTIVFLSAFISTLASRLIFNFQFIETWTIIILLGLFLFFLGVTAESEWISEKYWDRSMQGKFKAPLIGILREVQCENNADGHRYTSFLSDHWNTELRRLGLNTELITMDKLSNRYALIINPYGEVYPEHDPLLLNSFQKIKEYLREGGIFVCAGGIAFFYCWDSRARHSVTLSKIIQPYVQVQPSIFIPQFFYPPFYSLVDTLINEHFGVSVLGDPQPPPNAAGGWQPIFQTRQTNEDIRYVGDLSRIGGTTQVFVFRPVMPITRCCIPFLRADIPNFGETYPMAGIPYGRGLLIVYGVDLSTNAQVGSVNIARGEFEKICSAIANILNGIRLNAISYDWRRQR